MTPASRMKFQWGLMETKKQVKSPDTKIVIKSVLNENTFLFDGTFSKLGMLKRGTVGRGMI